MSTSSTASGSSMADSVSPPIANIASAMNDEIS
jgi:hypothetical protein